MRTLFVFKWPIVICGLAFAAGLWLVWSLFPGPGMSLLVPGDTVFGISKAGRYTLWTQVESSFQGKLMTFPTGLPPGVTIAITHENGSIVPVRSQWPTTHKETGGGSIQVAIGTVTFPSPGSYRVAAEGLQEKRALYLDQSDMRAFFVKAVIALALPIVFLGGIAWAIVIYVTRR